MGESEAAGESPATVWLVGAGIVGRAILRAHLEAGCDVRLVDADRPAVQAAVRELAGSGSIRDAVEIEPLGGTLSAVAIRATGSRTAAPHEDAPPTRPLIIESIIERLDVKRQFYQDAERWFDESAVFCTNTSSLTVGSIAAGMQRPERLCGMHFFMPVHLRPTVELVASTSTSPDVMAVGLAHLQRIGKQPLPVADGPAFVVNRMLVPYLNQALLLIAEGASAEQIERSALQFGMPMSPLELIDWIGTPTAFDVGRAFWQAFPERIDPAPLLPAMVKRKRFGRSVGSGLFDYAHGRRSDDLADETQKLSRAYARDPRAWSDDQVLELLAIPMWIEAGCLLHDRIVCDFDAIESAMAGGLGFAPNRSWFEFFENLGASQMLAAIETWSETWRAMRPPPGPNLVAALRQSRSPRRALEAAIDLTGSRSLD